MWQVQTCSYWLRWNDLKTYTKHFLRKLSFISSEKLHQILKNCCLSFFLSWYCFIFYILEKRILHCFHTILKEKNTWGEIENWLAARYLKKEDFDQICLLFFLDLTNLHFFISYEIWKYLGHCFGTHRIQMENIKKKTR